MRKPWTLLVACLIAGAVTVSSQPADSPNKPTLYLVSTAHLDTQWNWTVQDTIRQFIPDTFRTNFGFIEKYPDYVFTWEGAIHYMWFKEYHPEEWPTVQKYVAADRWRLAGSWINAVDTHIPSPESLMRQALYAKRFYRQEFKKTSQDIYLPDCFGFGFALPSIAAHCGLKSFSTQKLTWGRPIPFPIGRWKGVDGSEILAALNPGDYVTRLQTDISVDPDWTKEFTPLGDGTSVGFRYFGTGDVGGGPTEDSVRNFEKALRNPNGRIAIKNTSADQLSRDLTPQQLAALPDYTGELILKTHGTGCYTSQAAMKKFNRVNELLADAAERAAVAAQWLTGLSYPAERLREAWIRVLWHQFHDDLTGTSIPQAYQFSWNDELASMNQFAGVLTSSSSAVASVMDTRGEGTPLVVYNPLSVARREPVEATVRFGGAPPAAVRVTDASRGRAVPVQILGREPGALRILFLADVPSVGYAVFHVSAAAASAPPATSVTVSAATLENNRLTVRIDANGDISSVYDKDAKRELLRAPVMLELRDNFSPVWPAWEMLYQTVQGPAREYVARPAVKIVERGPVRVALEITRKAAGSTFVQRVQLTEGGDRVDVVNDVDWRSTDSLLKVSFPFAASNPKATYDLGLGTIDRTNNEPDKYEVPGQKWAGVTDTSGTFGAAVINDSKYGWDKPTDDTLRLTLLHTPRPQSFAYQSSNDLGRHRFTYAIAGHAGDWRQGRLPARAAALNQPLIAFQAEAHAGDRGRRFSMLTLDDLGGQVAVVALKKAEDSGEIVVRLQEQYGQPARAILRLPAGVESAREINAAEEDVGAFALPPRRERDPGPRPMMVVDLKPYQPRTIAFTLVAGVATSEPRASAPIALPYNLDGISTDRDRGDGDFDGKGHTIAGEQLPPALDVNGVRFTLGASTAGARNVYVPRGESLPLPEGSFNRVYFLASAVGGDVPASIGAGTNARRIVVREWQGAIGQWDSRLKAPTALTQPFVPAGKDGTPSQAEIQQDLLVQWDSATGEVSGIDRIRPGFVKRDEIAWIGTHRHEPAGNQIYVASYVFLYGIDVPGGTRAIRMPNDSRIRILAATATREPARLRPAVALYTPELGEPRP